MIPHIIHFVVGRTISPSQQSYIDKAREHHPDWEVKVWQDPPVPSFHRLSGFWPNANSGAQLADLIRLDVVYKYGGIYLDSDVEILKSLRPLADNCEFFVCTEDGSLATNAVFGATPGHAVLGKMIEDLLASPPDWSIPPCVTTGPEFFGKMLKWQSDIVVLPRATFYPYNWNEEPRPAAPTTYGVHRWDASWKPKVSFNETFLQTKKMVRKMMHPRQLVRDVLAKRHSGDSLDERRIEQSQTTEQGYNASGNLVRKTVHGHSIVLSASDLLVTPQVYLNGYYDLREELFLRRALSGGDYVIDVGANVGVYSLLAASRVGPFGRVFSYEPKSENADLLEKSAIMNWMRERIVVRGADLNVKSLDEEFAYDIPVRVLKIGAEGVASNVLAGAERLLSHNCIDFIALDVVEECGDAKSSTLARSLELLVSYGYRPHRYLKDGYIREATLWQVCAPCGSRIRNMLFKREGASGPVSP